MLPDRVSNPGPLTYESGALPIALRGPAVPQTKIDIMPIYGKSLLNKFGDLETWYVKSSPTKYLQMMSICSSVSWPVFFLRIPYKNLILRLKINSLAMTGFSKRSCKSLPLVTQFAL